MFHAENFAHFLDVLCHLNFAALALLGFTFKNLHEFFQKESSSFLTISSYSKIYLSENLDIEKVKELIDKPAKFLGLSLKYRFYRWSLNLLQRIENFVNKNHVFYSVTGNGETFKRSIFPLFFYSGMFCIILLFLGALDSSSNHSHGNNSAQLSQRIDTLKIDSASIKFFDYSNVKIKNLKDSSKSVSMIFNGTNNPNIDKAKIFLYYNVSPFEKAGQHKGNFNKTSHLYQSIILKITFSFILIIASFIYFRRRIYTWFGITIFSLSSMILSYLIICLIFYLLPNSVFHNFVIGYKEYCSKLVILLTFFPFLYLLVILIVDFLPNWVMSKINRFFSNEANKEMEGIGILDSNQGTQ